MLWQDTIYAAESLDDCNSRISGGVVIAHRARGASNTGAPPALSPLRADLCTGGGDGPRSPRQGRAPLCPLFTIVCAF